MLTLTEARVQPNSSNHQLLTKAPEGPVVGPVYRGPTYES